MSHLRPIYIIVSKSKSSFLVSVGAHMHILFIVKMKSLVLIKWLYRYERVYVKV